MKLTIDISELALALIRDLRRTGLYGKTDEEAAERILCVQLMKEGPHERRKRAGGAFHRLTGSAIAD